MKSKLAASQKILEGIATENFTTIAEQARKLELFSRAAAWSAHSTPEYRRFTEDFRRHASALAKNAQNRNLDAATVSWFQLTVSCVNCHKYMRGDEVASSSVYLSDNL